MSEKNREHSKPAENKNITKETNTSEKQLIPGGDITEVKNANASGMGSMGRHDEESENQEGALQKD